MQDLTRFEKIALITMLIALLGLLTFRQYQNSSRALRIDTAKFSQIKEIIDLEPLPININTASEGRLATLPGIGPGLAHRIVEYRQQFGKFKNKEELLKVKGLGVKKLELIENRISVDEK